MDRSSYVDFALDKISHILSNHKFEASLTEITKEGLWNRSDNIHWVKAVATCLVNY